MSKRGLYYKLVASQEEGFTSNNRATSEISLDPLQNDGSTSSSHGLSLVEIDIEDSSISMADSVENQSLEKLKEAESDISIWKLISLNKPEWKYILLGVVGSVIMGLSTPVYAIVFGELMGLLDQSLQEDVQHLNNILGLVMSTDNYVDVFNWFFH